MVKKLTVLGILITILANLTAFSQKGTNNNTDTCTITVSCATAQNIANELVKGDSCIAELIAAQSTLTLTKQENKAKQGIINAYVVKEQTYKKQVDAYKEIQDTQESMIVGLEKRVKRLKSTSKFLGSVLGTAGSVLIVTTIVGFLMH